MLTIIKTSKIERLQAQLVSERINANQLTEMLQKVRQENDFLRQHNLILYKKANRERNEKGQFTKHI